MQSATETDTRPRWANDFAEPEFYTSEAVYTEPKDFVPASDGVFETVEVVETITHEEDNVSVDADQLESVKSMTFEDMMLTWLAMLGSSGEYDDEIFIILGLILMIGA